MPAVAEAEGSAYIAARAHALVRDLHTANSRIYWLDLILTGTVGWGAFAVAVLFPPWTPPTYWALFVCVCALYRGLCFLHEVTHLRAGTPRGYESAWNIIFGVPLLLPSFMYVGVHQYHHQLSTYGTGRDPEYLPFSGKPRTMAVFAIESFLVPLMLIARFFVLAPIGLAIPAVHRTVCVRFSSLCLNMKFRRDVPAALERKIKQWEAIVLASWIALAWSLTRVHMAWRCLAVWCAVLACVSVVNTLRTLGAHRYESDGTARDRDEQLIDSIDTPGAFWTELWAPAGLRYHALHHYFPGIPYHNLGKAHNRLAANLPAGAIYHRVGSRSLYHSLRALYSGSPRKMKRS